MRAILTGFFGLLLYVGFLVATFFVDSTAVGATGEIEPIIVVAGVDSLNVGAGNYSEQYRPPVYIGIGPGGPPNHVIALRTGVIKKSELKNP